VRWGALFLICSGCALPAVSAGTFLPAGDLKKGDWDVSASIEAGRVLAGPTDLGEKSGVPPETARWEVLTWIASDLAARWQAFDRIAFEAELKLTNPVVPFAPAPVGAAVGARVRLMDHEGPEGFAAELGGRFVGVGVTEELQRSQDGRTQLDRWTYRALGLEMPLILSYRVAPALALTWSPFVRAYWIRIWHETVAPDGSQTVTRLQWTPVLSAGLGVSAAMRLGWLEVAPGCALELATRPGPSTATKLLVEPGLSLAVRF
jgi:hypothetical protein